MRYPLLAAVLSCFFALPGCSTAPAKKPAALQIPRDYKEAGIWQQARPAEAAPRGDWWREFQDSALDQLITRLDAANSDLALAASRFDQASALAAQARSGLFPAVAAGAGASKSRQSAHRPLRSANQPNIYTDRTLGMGAQYELDLWGRVRESVAAGKASAEAAGADLESIHLSLRAELVNDYVALRGLDTQEKLLRGVIGNYQRALSLTESRHAGGIASALDVYRARAQLETVTVKLSDAATARSQYEHAIATLVGEPASSFSIAPVATELAVPKVPVGVPAELLQRRPDIAAAERRMEAANAQIGIAKAAFFPTVMLGAGGGYESSTAAQWLSAPNLFWSLGPSALLTLFDAGRREAQVAQAQAAHDGVAAQYRGTVLRAFQDVEDNLSLLHEAEEEWSDVEAAVADNGHAQELAMNRYREGAVTYLEVVVAENALLQSQLDELGFRDRRLHATVNLIRSLGGGWQAPTLTKKAASAPVGQKPG